MGSIDLTVSHIVEISESDAAVSTRNCLPFSLSCWNRSESRILTEATELRLSCLKFKCFSAAFLRSAKLLYFLTPSYYASLPFFLIKHCMPKFKVDITLFIGLRKGQSVQHKGSPDPSA